MKMPSMGAIADDRYSLMFKSISCLRRKEKATPKSKCFALATAALRLSPNDGSEVIKPASK